MVVRWELVDFLWLDVAELSTITGVRWAPHTPPILRRIGRYIESFETAVLVEAGYPVETIA